MDRRTVAALTLSAAGLVGIATSEGFRSRSYDDGVGVQTVGFGTAYVKPGTTMTVERALIALQEEADKHQVQMRKCVGEVPLAQREWDAYVSLSYNVGSGAFCRSGIVRALHQQPPDYGKACAGILPFNKAGGNILPGLVARRQREYKMCMGLE